MDYALRLPDGSRLEGKAPVVVIGPNGSGKTRQTRNLRADIPIEFVNALRNTRVAPELPAMGMDTARNNYMAQKQQAQNQHWELTSEFDYMLSQLLAQDAMAAKDFTRKFRSDPTAAGHPEETPLSRVEALWSEIFPGRNLQWRDWKPIVVSSTSGIATEYTANHMSDGEKSVLFLAGRVFSADTGILVVDEPETHIHSLLAVRLWNALEDARPDLRFVYVTHDLNFAMSRRHANYILASPTAGLRAIEIDDELPSDVAEALLGSASLSFYASRIVFCEGGQGSLDNQLYGAWFSGVDTVVRPVEDSQSVIRCVDVLSRSSIAQSLDVIGIIDRDYHNDAFIEALANKVHILPVHEIESLLAWPEVVSAVATHIGINFDEVGYLEALRNTVSEEQRTSIVIARWKDKVEPHLTGLVSSVKSRSKSLEVLATDMSDLFNAENWKFSPQVILTEEKERVEKALATRSLSEFFSLVPGKQLASLAARFLGMEPSAYYSLIFRSLREKNGKPLERLRDALVAALKPLLPPRAVPIALQVGLEVN